MPRINPRSLIKCLETLLTEEGGIKGIAEVTRMVGLMEKFSNTLVSKVCYTLILKKTEDSLLTAFLSAGGWKLVFQWLGNAIHSGNNPFIKEILQLLIKCPIRIDFLRESNAPRIVKGLSKDSEDPVVRELAKQVVEMWLDYIKSNQAELCHVPEPATAPVPESSSPDMKLEPESSDTDQFLESPKEKKAQLIPPFKLILRDGKRYFVQIDPETVPNKIRKIKKESDDGDSHDGDLTLKNGFKITSKQVKVRNIENTSDTNNIKLKDLKKPGVEMKKKDIVKSKTDKKDYSRTSSSSSSHKSVKSSHSRAKESEIRKDKAIKDYSRVKVQSKSKESVKKTEVEPTEEAFFGPGPPMKLLGKIPKKTVASPTMSAAEATATGGVLGGGSAATKEPIPLPTIKKGTYSDERKRSADIKPSDRPRIVKTLPTKFRSTGLEEEVKPPSARKKEPSKEVAKRPAVPPSTSSSSSSSIKDPSTPPPEKKPKVTESKEKKEKTENKPPTPKIKPVLLESDMFSDALTASSSKDVRKKKSRRSSSSGSSSSSTKDGERKKSSEDSSKKRREEKRTTPEVKAPNFYRDTLDDSESQSTKTEEDESPSEPPKAKTYPEGVLVISRSKRAPKKSVRWRAESELVSTQFFELDENERVNVSRCNFMDLKALERNREREAFLMHKQGTEPEKDEKPYGPLFLVDIPPDKQCPERGQKSLEKEIQRARQQTVLEAIFFSKSLIPDSPQEPDVENHPMTDPKPIPLEDGSGKEFDHSNKPWPDGKTDKMDIGQPISIGSAISNFIPMFTPIPGLAKARENDEVKDGVLAGAFQPNGINIPPPGIRHPFGPPGNVMMGTDAFNMPMFPPNGFFGNIPPISMIPPPGWAPVGGWNGPRPPLPLEAQNICRSWNRSGKCYRGNLCRFLHPGSNCPPLS